MHPHTGTVAKVRSALGMTAALAARPVPAAVICFAFSRLAMLGLWLVVAPDKCSGDIELYARYAQACELAWRTGTSPYAYTTVEYPPLALGVMALPRLGVDATSSDLQTPPSWLDDYRRCYRVQMALLDVVCFLGMMVLVGRLFAHEPDSRRASRLNLYTAYSLACGHLLYSSLDLGVAACCLWVTAALVYRRFALAAVVCALGACFKVVPVVLVPLVALAALDWHRLTAAKLWRDRVRALAPALAVCVIAAVVVAGVFAVSAAVFGPGVTEFYRYHKDRGFEIGSVWSSGLMVARRLGEPVHFYFAHCSFNAGSAWSGPLVAIAPVVAGLALLAALAAYARRRWAEVDEDATATARSTVNALVLVVAAFLLTNKVFSPQFMIWLLPLLPLLSLSRRSTRTVVALMLVAAVFTTAMSLFATQIMFMRVGTTAEGRRIFEPHWVGECLQLGRNVLMFAFTAVVCRAVILRTAERPNPA